jgi:hypothetical protein
MPALPIPTITLRPLASPAMPWLPKTEQEWLDHDRKSFECGQAGIHFDLNAEGKVFAFPSDGHCMGPYDTMFAAVAAVHESRVEFA